MAAEAKARAAAVAASEMMPSLLPVTLGEKLLKEKFGDMPPQLTG
jgi:hypothetical protein